MIFNELFKTLPTEKGDHAYLIKKFGHHAPQAALLLDMRRGNDRLGDYIAYVLHGQNGRVIGYQRIYAEIPKGREDNKDFIGSTKGVRYCWRPFDYSRRSLYCRGFK